MRILLNLTKNIFKNCLINIILRIQTFFGDKFIDNGFVRNINQ